MKHESIIWSCGRMRVLLSLCLSLGFLNCDNESDEDVADAGDECTDIGDQESCTCSSGQPGTRTCYPDLVYSECECELMEEKEPCSAPGEEYACLCDDDEAGVLYCQDNRVFSECFCGGDSVPGAGGSPSSSGSSDGCPEPFDCALQPATGDSPAISICVNASTFPPFCENNDDCVDEGLPGAQCLDPGEGIEVCIYRCD